MATANMDRLHTLVKDLSQLFNLESNLDSVLAVAMYKLSQAVNSESSSIFLIDPLRQQLVCFSSLDIEKREIRVSKSSSIAGWVFENRQPVIVNHVYNDCRFYSRVDEITGFKTRNMICTPLIDLKECCLGTLQSLNKVNGDFDADDLELLGLASHLVAVAMDNSRLYRELKTTSRAGGLVLEKLANNVDPPR